MEMWRIKPEDLVCLTQPQGVKEFVAKLGYKVNPLPRDREVSLTDRAKALLAGEVIEISRQTSSLPPFIFLHIPLQSEKFRRTELRTIINCFFSPSPQFGYLFFFTSQKSQDVAIVCPKILLKDHKPVFSLRTLLLNPHQPYRTDLEILNQIVLDGEPSWERIDEAFDVERVTEKFFREFQEKLEEVEGELNRLSRYKDQEWAHEYALRLLSRIMFLYFLQRKGWLNNDLRFIRNFYSQYKSHRRWGDNFHRDWLNALFFSAFNRKWEILNSDEIKERFPPDIVNFLRRAPYLNGGLFLEDKLDAKAEEFSAFLPDEIFDELIYKDGEPGFFEHYNFTIAENTPLDQEVAVDPEMIGKVYESLAFKGSEEEKTGREGRKAGGIFYTPRVEIDLMCRLSLADYLSNNLDIDKKLLYQWLFAFSEEEKQKIDSQLPSTALQQLWETLMDIKVLDPACGSGSFLVQMLLILDDLLQRLEPRLEIKRSSYERRKQIIQYSLYGVDLLSWAVQVAELRLWLQLIVETEIENFSYTEPLLPNLSFNIRQGDSLLQKIANYVFHSKSLSRSCGLPGIKRKIEEIKKEKRKFYRSGSPQQEEKIKSMERGLLLELIGFRNTELLQEIKSIEAKLQDEELWSNTGPKTKEKEKLEEEKEEKEKEREELLRVEESVRREERELPFIWDVAFPEVFEEGGFDIVIGNPPYIREKKINDVVKLKGAPSYARIISDYKSELINGLVGLYPFFFMNRKIDALSDFYVYFYLYCLSLLKEKGSFCFITSNSWLDVDFGRVLQEFLLRHSEIKMIIDNSAKRSFSQALINTVIVLLSPPQERAKFERRLARFVRFKVPFEEILAKELGEARAVPFWEIEETEETKDKPEFLCQVRKQGDLLREGSDERGVYKGEKWGGKYFRAPNIFFKVLEKAGDRLCKLREVGEVKLGFITGADEFFYLEEIGREGGISCLRNAAGWEGRIEEECLRPLIESFKDLKSIKGNRDFPLRVFYVQEPPHRLKRLYPLAYEYVKWGEEKGYPDRPTCKGRKYWYFLGENPPGDIILARLFWEMYFVPLNEGFLLDASLYNLYLKSRAPEDKIMLLLFLNSSLFPLLVERYSRISGGGLLELKVYEFEMMDCLNPGKLSPGERRAFLDFYARREDFLLRPIKSIFEELGFPKPAPDYSNINVEDFSPDKVLPDRRELDEIVFSVLGLKGEEKIELYKAVVQLVKNRLSKARSVRRQRT